jgi:ABC-type uncharacterized transport system permease subunit
MHVIAYASAAVLYAAAAAVFAVRFVRGRPGPTALLALIIVAGLLSHAAGIALYWVEYGEPPLVGLGPSLGSLAFLIALALAGLGILSPARTVGLLLAPTAAALLLVAIFIGVEPTGSEMAFRGRWLALHVSLAFIGYAGWVVAAAAGLMYLLQWRQLKNRRLGAIFEFFPPLDTLDKLAEWAMVTGFASLTLGMAVGWAWTLRFEGGMRWSEPKIVWGALVWFALLIALWARLGGRKTRVQAALWNVAGFVVVSVAYLIAKMLLPETQRFL